MSKERENELFNYLKELLVDIKHQYVSNGDLVQEMYDLVEAFDYDKILVCINLLNQWHFDYRNLIGEGLATDINTLN